ncbi:response regulator [Leptolyngbya sp. FACHB-261]|uniref:response regulator n=1 Tax=Leptolyngbya sp. FACHB-261 TaxID=2692806 RepID=UPI0016835F9E|nr:response regulator [Leptolyngbya sp. FACHB-261]MBD2104022.1 response regulator [Leptolyngbya sp. FACHB-261]
MAKGRFKKGEFGALLNTLHQRRFTGKLQVLSEQETSSQLIERVIFFKNGWIIYAGIGAPTIELYIRILSPHLKKTWERISAEAGLRKLGNIKVPSINNSYSFLGWLVYKGILTWEQVLSILEPHVLLVLERLLPNLGTFSLTAEPLDTIAIGFHVSELLHKVTTRQRQLSTLAPQLTSLNDRPVLNSLPCPESADILNSAQYKSFQKFIPWIDGDRSILDLAELQSQDTLKLAHACSVWSKAGWLRMVQTTSAAYAPTIVAIDDSAVMLELVKRSLKQYRVLTAQRATEGLALIFHEKPDLVVLDVSMPELDGFNLCSTIRSVDSCKHIPVLMLTARDGFLDKMRGRMAGTTEYLTKPFEGEKLCEVVDKYLQRKMVNHQDSVSKTG